MPGKEVDPSSAIWTDIAMKMVREPRWRRTVSRRRGRRRAHPDALLPPRANSFSGARMARQPPARFSARNCVEGT